LCLAVGEATQLRFRAGGVCLAQLLLGAAQPRHKPVGEPEHLRRRAVVGLQPHDRRAREALRQRQQVVGRRPGERVDRLVVVANRAELVAVAEPELEQGLLWQVDVLVLVDREGAVAIANLRERLGLVLEQLDREREQVLEVERARSLLAALVLAEDTCHQVVRDRGLVAVQAPTIGLGVSRRFLAHSTSVARSTAGRNLYGIGSVLPIWRSISAFEARILPGGSPRNHRSCANAAEWNVRARTPPAPSSSSRLRISRDALSVKVTARICSAGKAPAATWCAIRLVIVVVLPEPAPARMQTGPRTVSTARRCSGFSPSKIAAASTGSP